MNDASKSNLRPGGPRFVGRTAELARLDALHAEGHRLVTVFGPPGTGKTRLAEAFARRMAPELCGPGGGGVWVVELAQERDVEGVCAVLGRTLGVPASAPATDEVVRRLGDAIAARGPILLVLDNFEQLVDVAASSVGAWLAAAPDARFLVTSRAPLRLRDEVRFDLPALTLPGPGVPVASSEAVQLFIDRVRSFDTAFALADANEGVVAELVRKLEGIPLAIELAACRVELFGVGGLLEQLDKRLDVLEQDTRDVDDRHATLRAAIDWSWGLLDDDERRVLASCAVFRGGFTADAARSVLAGTTTRPVLSVVQALRDESLLRRIDVDGSAGHSRFSLFESVREFAEERLVSLGQQDDARRRHAEHYLAAGEKWTAQIGARGGPEALRQLALERDNLLAVHAFALEEPAPESVDRAIRAALVLDALAAVRGPFGSHLELLDRTIAAAETPTLAPVMRARLLQARARTRAMHGQSAAAQRDFDAALAVAPVTAAQLQAELGVDVAVHAHQQRRDLDAALVLYEQALALARSAGARAVEGRALGNLGALHHDLRHFDKALALYREALAVVQEVGDRRLEAIHVANLGILEQETGELTRARAHFQTADELLAELGDRRLQAIVIGNLGTLEQEEGNPETARTCHERALVILREVGDRRSEALCLGRLARANAALEWIDDAIACLSAADRLLGRYDDPLARASVEMNRGFVDVASARVAQRRNDADACAKAVAEARGRITKASTRGAAALSWVEQSDDIRAAVRILEREIERLDDAQPPAIARPALVLGPDAKWFQVPGADAQDLRKRKSLRAILWGLAQRHREEPGGGLALEDLLELGWPGERVMPSAGANRVYVALTTLRNMGLRGHLISQGDGYLLDPALPVERVVYEQPS